MNAKAIRLRDIAIAGDFELLRSSLESGDVPSKNILTKVLLENPNCPNYTHTHTHTPRTHTHTHTHKHTHTHTQHTSTHTHT